MPGSDKKTVLVIEDETDIRNFVSRVLQLEDYNVLQAKDGDEGLDLAGSNNVDLLFVDLRLPGRDGWSILEQVKAEPKLCKIKVIVFTASAGVPERERAINMGAVNYLVKPLSAASLKEAADQAVKN